MGITANPMTIAPLKTIIRLIKTLNKVDEIAEFSTLKGYELCHSFR